LQPVKDKRYSRFLILHGCKFSHHFLINITSCTMFQDRGYCKPTHFHSEIPLTYKEKF
jgi:hypothetical protein